MEMVGPRTKGLRLDAPRALDELRSELAASPRRVDDDLFAWPLLTLDDDALAHNMETMADVCREFGVWHAPHIKTPMSAQLWARQAAAGAWAATVAMPHQLRVAHDWGVPRVLLANELVDAREARWLASALATDADFEVWLEVDSDVGIEVLTEVFSGMVDEVLARLHPLVEVGVPGGRTGVRTSVQAVALARQLVDDGWPVSGVIGYEGPVAGGASAEDLAAVATWVQQVIHMAGEVADVASGASPSGEPFVVSLGGSAYLDVVLPALGALPAGWQGVVRAGAYATHDHVHYAVLNPWARLPGGRALRPAITVWAQVLSLPEQGLALLGAGRRDVAFDLDMPVPLWWRRCGEDGRLGLPTQFGPDTRVTQVNDQHAFVALGDEPLRVGDVVGLGMSHPCTVFDKWRLAAVTRGDDVIDLYSMDF